MAGTNQLRVAAMVAALVLASALALLLGGALALFTTGAHPAHAQTAPPGDFVPGEILVKFEPGASGQEIAEANRRGGGQVEQTIPGIGVRVVDVPAGHEQSAVAAYERNPNVSYAELDGVTRLATYKPDDPLFPNQWQYNKIHAFEPAPTQGAWDITTGNSDVDIAIVDTGIDQTHEDLAGKIAASQNFTKSRTLNDKVGHGTHVAGSAAALTNNSIGVAGTCPKCLLYNVKVVGDKGTGTVSSLAKGITWSANNGAEVINMSLGSTSGSRTLRDAVDYAWRKGVVLVAAAGNNRTKAPFYPAYYDHVIAVAATNDKDAKPKFSDYGTWVDVAAPGVNILSTWPHDRDHPDGRYKYLSGTSMATPHVAGVAGLVWSTPRCIDGDPNTNDAACVRDRIESTADPIPGTGTLWAYGRINAYEAVASP